MTPETILFKIMNYASKGYKYDNFDFEYNFLIDEDSTKFFTLESSYNYYISKYEDRLGRLPEEILPNFYVFSLSANPSTNTISESNYDNSKLVGDDSPYQGFDKKFDNLITLNNNASFEYGIPHARLFIQKYAESYDEVNVDYINTYRERFSNIVNDIDDISLLNSIENFVFQYPMSINLTFSTNKTNELSQIIKESSLNSKIINDIKFSEGYLLNKVPVTEITTTSGDIMSSVELKKELNYSDFQTWLDKFIDDKFENIQNLSDFRFNDIIPEVYSQQSVREFDLINLPRNDQTIIGNNSSDLNIYSQSDLLGDSIVRQLLSIKIKDLIIKNTRTYKQILHSDLSVVETIFYKIEKRDIRNKLIQTFYLINVPGLDILKYFDTQVKPHKQYKYKIFSINVVFGTKYQYKTSFSYYNEIPRSVNVLGQAITPQSEPIVFDPSSNPESIEQSEPVVIGLSSESTGEKAATPILIFNTQVIIPNQNSSSSNKPPTFSVSEKPVTDSTKKPTENSVVIESGNIDQNLLNLASQTQQDIVDEAGFNGVLEESLVQDENKISFYVEYEPSIKILELECSEQLSESVTDKPPLYPEVLFLPLLNELNKFNICFFEIFSEIEEKFIKILESDIDYNNFNRISPIRNHVGLTKLERFIPTTKIKFNGEGDTKFIQLFVSSEKPYSYQDFLLYKTIDFKTEKNVLESITINKEYFYFFRTIDNKNNISNPSPIYKVILFSNNQRSFLDVKEFVFEVIEHTQKKLPMKKYLKIDPAGFQKIINYETQKLGLANKKTYNNDFLIKLTSKHTGKQIRIKFKFNISNI